MKGHKATVLRLLRERGARGIGVHELIYEHGITRAAAVVHELKKLPGIEIETIDEGGGKLARYVLTAAIATPVPMCICGDRKSGHIVGQFKCMRFDCKCEAFRAA